MKRPDQNQALKDLQELVAIIIDFEQDVRGILLRNQFQPVRVATPWRSDDPMKGTGPPYYGDPTGEEAIADDERLEDIAKTISKMAQALHQWNEMAQWMKNLAGTDVVARAERTMPSCLACGDQCIDRVFSGFDQKCFQRWTREHRPDRYKFIAKIKSERVQEIAEQTQGPDLR